VAASEEESDVARAPTAHQHEFAMLGPPNKGLVASESGVNGKVD
jgi:hypothetical protein